jgi:hypothetical protein
MPTSCVSVGRTPRTTRPSTQVPVCYSQQSSMSSAVDRTGQLPPARLARDAQGFRAGMQEGQEGKPEERTPTSSRARNFARGEQGYDERRLQVYRQAAAK